MLKNRVRIGSPIKKSNQELLRKISEETFIPMSTLLDIAIENLGKKYEQKDNNSNKKWYE